KSVDRDISDTYFNKMCQRIKAMNYSGLKSFLKVISKKRNLIKTTQLLKKYPGLLHTSIQFPQLITMIHRFIRMQQLPSKKLFLPLTDTFRVVNREDKKKVIVIDFTRNRNVLHQVAMEKAN
ncbi:hypothetical protein GHB17_08310, partial [Enterococcus faecium]|nr:hypothetical protein [Enterococcus faecium]MCZ1646047.1 hypothetical protein [Enterococcus faecium]MCZ1657412.1 hypothetical protein [Enterococcus faecium]MCZ1660320.1 hypothetical protein [Enterococcus faecium]MCZ1663121.1 hypothetical protein [Enterococcus faecium]